MFGSEPATAASYVAVGQVQWVRTHDAIAYPTWAPPRFWFTLTGVSKVGNCVALNGGNVLFVANDLQMLALVVTAQTHGEQIEVSGDDTNLVNTFCSVGHLTLGNPAPTF